MVQPAVTPRTYVVIYGSLLVLTLTTLLVAQVDLGAWSVPVALAIAIVKATLVTLFFMHLLYLPRINWLVVSAGAIFLVILLALTLSDYWTRSWLPARDIPPSRDLGTGQKAPY
jgi:cytochrome c oxidase subunit 4